MTKVQPGQSISEVPEPTTAGDPPIRRSGWILLWSANVVISLSVIALLPTRDTAHLVVAGVFAGIGSVMVAMVGLRLFDSTRDGESVSGVMAAALAIPWCAAIFAAPALWLSSPTTLALLFGILDRRVAYLASTAYAAAGSSAIWLTMDLSPGMSVGAAVGTFVYSQVLSWQIARIIGESHERKELLRRLERTRGLLSETSHHNGVLSERQRLAREIHDTVTQGLASMRILLEAAEIEMDTDPDKARQHLHLARCTADESHQQARTLVNDGVVDGLEQEEQYSLVQMLDRLVQSQWAFSAKLSVEGEPRTLNVRTTVNLLRIAQESLANVHKHAQAERATVALHYERESTTLTITDDGVGFDEAIVFGRGYGLSGMRERITSEGGEFSVCTTPKSGTTIHVRVPALFD